MKICLITDSEYRGGLDTFITNLCNGWPDKTHCFHLYINESHPAKESFKKRVNRKLSVETYKNPRRWLQTPPHNGSVLVWCLIKLLSWSTYYLVYFPYFVFNQYRYFLANDYDALIVVNGGHPGSLICRASIISWRLANGRGKPSIYTVHNFPSYEALPVWARAISTWVDRLVDIPLLASVTAIRTVSKTSYERFRPLKEIFQSKKFGYVYNGIEDPTVAGHSSLELSSNLSQNCLMLATFEERKGHEFALNAWAEVNKRCHNLKLFIYGFGTDSQKRKINEMIAVRQLKSSVFLKDFNPGPFSLLAATKILIVPSQDYESFGLTVIEAMAMSVPVIATNNGGPAEILGLSGGGIVCDKENHIEFANAIVDLAENNDRMQHLGSMGRACFESEFTAEKMSKQYNEILKSVSKV